MRTLIALLMFGLSASANATLIQLDIHGTPRESSVGVPFQSAVEASLLLDTAGAMINIDSRAGTNTDVPICNLSFLSVSSGQVLGISIDGMPAFEEITGVTAPTGLGVSFRGAPSCPPPRREGAGLNFGAGGNSFALGFRTAQDAVSLDEVRTSTDPLATLLLSGFLTQGGLFSLVTTTGNGIFSVDELSIRNVTDVPEPPMPALLLMGLAGLLIGRRRRASRTSVVDGHA